MLNEELIISICRGIDGVLSTLERFNNKHVDYSKEQCDYKKFHNQLRSCMVAIASKKAGVGMGDVCNFYDNPSFNVQLNATNYENNSIAGCFFVAPVESTIKIVSANYDLLKLNEEEREKAEACDLQTIIKTTRVKMFAKAYSVTEQIMNLPAPLIKQSSNEYFATNESEILNDKSFDELPAEEQRALCEKSKAYIWEKYKELICGSTYNNTLVNNWYDYKKAFKETYGEEFRGKDDNGLSLWQDEGFVAFDNRKIGHNGETVTLEEQYKLSLLKK